jgi:tetratricopeptide (TPR) repeat protein
MPIATFPDFCPANRLDPLLASLRANEERAFGELESILAEFPDDPRLHFLRGSLLAGRQDYAAARAAMQRAVDLAPGFAVARFQLGLLLLTSGEPHAALEKWGPLQSLPPDHFLRLFVAGLSHLIQDDFGEAIRLIREGIAGNQENPAMNRDMQMIVDELERRQGGGGESGKIVSSVDLLLQQAALKAGRH